MTKKQILIRAFIALLFLVVLAGLLVPVTGRTVFVDPLRRASWQSRSLHDFLVQYADAHDGNFPQRVTDLASEYPETDETYWRFPDLQTRQPLDWIYFSGRSRRDPRDTILLASPKPISKEDGTRVVGRGLFRYIITVDGRGAVLPESEYQSWVAEQQRPEWIATARGPSSWEAIAAARAYSIQEAALSRESHPAPSPKNTSRLVDELRRSTEKRERQEAADALGEIGDVTPDAVSALLAALEDDDVGYSASRALAAISDQIPGIAQSLAEAVRSGRGKARYWATEAMGELGGDDPAAIPLLVEALSSDRDQRSGAIQALANFGPAARSAVPGLIACVQSDAEKWDAKRAMIALGRIGPEAREAISMLSARWEADADYAVDAARALWKIDPTQSAAIVPKVIAHLVARRDSTDARQNANIDGESAIALLGEIGPEARAAIPILRENLRGGSALYAAWALWRIDPTLVDLGTPILLSILNPAQPPDRFDRLARAGKPAMILTPRREETFGEPFGPRLAAAGMLWQMHPDKREEIATLLDALLREWNTNRVLKDVDPTAEAATPALSDMQKLRPHEYPPLARALLRTIATTDYGGW